MICRLTGGDCPLAEEAKIDRQIRSPARIFFYRAFLRPVIMRYSVTVFSNSRRANSITSRLFCPLTSTILCNAPSACGDIMTCSLVSSRPSGSFSALCGIAVVDLHCCLAYLPSLILLQCNNDLNKLKYLFVTL